MEIDDVHLRDGDYIFGFPEEWAKFKERFPGFLNAFDSLVDTANRVRRRTFTPQNHPVDLTVFFLCCLVFEDFTEVWVMAGNELGTGALKVLRGMYERAVTAAYLSKFPDEAKQFWKYWSIPHRKLLNHAREIHGLAFIESVLGPDHIKTVEDEYQLVKGDFQETLCPKCSLTRTMFSWSKLGLPAMAKKAGYGLADCYFNAYATPTQQAHSTVLSVTSRVKQQPDGHFFDNSVQTTYSALAIMTAHTVALITLRIENEHFSLGLDSEIALRQTEFEAAWPNIEDGGKGK